MPEQINNNHSGLSETRPLDRGGLSVSQAGKLNRYEVTTSSSPETSSVIIGEPDLDSPEEGKSYKNREVSHNRQDSLTDSCSVSDDSDDSGFGGSGDGSLFDKVSGDLASISLKDSFSCLDGRMYSLGEELGSGSFSRVLSLLDQQGKPTDLVIRIPHASEEGDDILPAYLAQEMVEADLISIPSSQPLAADLPTLSDTDQSLRIMERLGDHPNLNRCYGLIEVDGERGLVMERLDGLSFERLVQHYGRFYLEGLISDREYWGVMQYLMTQCFEGVSHIHRAGLVHCDLKPDNLIVQEPSKQSGGSGGHTLKLIDFGLTSPEGTLAAPGHELYSAPEALYVKTVGDGLLRVNRMLDIYSLGHVILGLFNAYTEKKRTSETRVGAQLKAFLANGGSLKGESEGMEVDAASIEIESQKPVSDADLKAVMSARDIEPEVRSVLEELQNLVQHMMQFNPDQRPAIDEVKTHPFLSRPLLSQEEVQSLLDSRIKLQAEYIRKVSPESCQQFILSGIKSDIQQFVREYSDKQQIVRAGEELLAATLVNPIVIGMDEKEEAAYNLALNLFILMISRRKKALPEEKQMASLSTMDAGKLKHSAGQKHKEIKAIVRETLAPVGCGRISPEESKYLDRLPDFWTGQSKDSIRQLFPNMERLYKEFEQMNSAKMLEIDNILSNHIASRIDLNPPRKDNAQLNRS